MIDYILQFAYPSYCCECRIFLEDDGVACSRCLDQIQAVTSLVLDITPRCKLHVFAAGSYDGILRKLILRKASSDRYASQQLGTLLTHLPIFKKLSIDTIVPIPLHWTRYAYRGYNQADVLARILGKKFDVPVVSALKRIRRTPFQSLLSAREREQNVKKVFQLRDFSPPFDREHLFDKNILLVDDLCTTGATLVQASRCLLACRPASVTAVVGARTV